MKKEREREKSNRLEVTWNMRSCSRKKYRPTIVPVKCPRNPLATGFPLAAFRSLLRREPRDFSSSGGTDVINDLRIGNPWNENREHHARIPATCACDRLRICEGRRMNLRAHELLPIPRSIHKKKARFLRETIIVLSTFRILSSTFVPRVWPVDRWSRANFYRSTLRNLP